MSETTESSATTDPKDNPDSRDTTDSSGAADSAEETTGPDPRLLEDLDEHIRGARAAAEDALGDAEHTFVESGDDRSEAEDGEAIAPPG